MHDPCMDLPMVFVSQNLLVCCPTVTPWGPHAKTVNVAPVILIAARLTWQECHFNMEVFKAL